LNTFQFFSDALHAFQRGQLDDAERGFKKFLRHDPKHFGALNIYAILLIQKGRYGDASSVLQRAIELNPSSEKTFCNYGLALKKLKRFDDALAAFSTAIKINPVNAENWNNRGTVNNDLERFEFAVADFDQALTLVQSYAEAASNKGRSLLRLRRYDEALAAFDFSLRCNRTLAQSWTGRGNVLGKLSRHAEALAAFQTATEVAPGFIEGWIGLADAICNVNGFTKEALAAYEAAITIDPQSSEAWAGKGQWLSNTSKFDDALAAYTKALQIDPQLPYGQGHIVYLKSQLCDWTGFTQKRTECLAGIDAARSVITPFHSLSAGADAKQQLRCATLFSKDVDPLSPALFNINSGPGERIRVAYMSGDFRDHAVAYLIAGVLEKHDPARFELFGISLSPETDSPVARRLKATFAEFHDVSAKNDIEIAQLLRALQIDIAVDLTGYTLHMRPGILAHRPAPVHVNYLGYAGTMGSPHRDYIIADKTVIPEQDQIHFAEKIAWLPDLFMPADDQRAISSAAQRRSDFDLPEQGFVFCAFNNAYKITPEIFDIWMRLLKQIGGSVLWLSKLNETARANLQIAAENRGVDSHRLVFAQHTERQEDHLARHRLADLFLDTNHYNAHTTANDALWAGLPVVTCTGSAFAGRVASSLVRAAGIPELVTSSLEDYEALAMRLASDPALLASVREKLAVHRPIAPLFDTLLYTRHLEAAYVTMHERARRGEAPASFAVPHLRVPARPAA